MLERLKIKIREQDFNPGLLGLFVNPFYFARQGLYKHISELAPSLKGQILDVGCGSKPYQKCFNASENYSTVFFLISSIIQTQEWFAKFSAKES